MSQGMRFVGKGTLPIESGYSAPAESPEGPPSTSLAVDTSRVPLDDSGGLPQRGPLGPSSGPPGTEIPGTADFVLLTEGFAKLGPHPVMLNQDELETVRGVVASAIARALMDEATRVISLYGKVRSLQSNDHAPLETLSPLSIDPSGASQAVAPGSGQEAGLSEVPEQSASQAESLRELLGRQSGGKAPIPRTRPRPSRGNEA